MRQGLVATLAVLAAAAAVAFLLWIPSPDRPAPVEARTATEAAAPAPTPEPAAHLPEPAAARTMAPAEEPTSPAFSPRDPGRPAATPNELAIAVRDAKGQPVQGVPVGVISASRGALVLHDRTSGPEATARWKDAASKLGTEPAAAVFAFPLHDGPQVPIDPAHLPPDPVVLVLPPTGAVEVVLDDVPREAGADVTISLRELVEGDARAGHVAKKTADDGIARFEWVGLGLRLRATGRRAGQNAEASIDFAGPAWPGQTASVRLSMRPPNEAVLVVRVLGPDGEPYRQRRLNVLLESRRAGSITSSSFGIVTDREGILRLAAGEKAGESAQRTLRLRDDAPEAKGIAAAVPVPERLNPGDNDLGTARLEPPPLLCSGVVLDPRGAGVADAHLSVSARSRNEWEDVRDVRGRTDAEGRFQLRGLCDAAEAGLSVSAEGYLPLGPVPFRPGADLQLQLEAAATVTGSVQLTDVVQAQDVIVELDCNRGRLDERVTPQGERGTFRFGSLPAGTASVRLRVLGETGGGLVVPDVELRAGEVNADPRLQDVDLSRGRRVVRFRVVGPDRLPVPEARVVILGGAKDRPFEGHVLDGATARVVTGADLLSVLAFAEGHRTVRATGVVDGQELVLGPALAVRLRLPEDCPPPQAPFRLDAILEATGDGPVEGSYAFYRGTSHTWSGDGRLPWRASPRAVCGADGTALLAAPEPGRYQVLWRLSRGTRSVYVGGRGAIDVADAPGEQVLPAGIGAADLERAKSQL